MNIQRLFRVLLVVSVAFGIAGVIYPTLGLHETSEDLEVILMWNGFQGIVPFHDNDEWGLYSIIGMALVLLTLIIFVTGLIGAFLFKKWGRTALAAATILGIVFTPFSGVMIGLPIEMLLYQISTGTFYIALTMGFFSPLKEKFNNDPSEGAAI